MKIIFAFLFIPTYLMSQPLDSVTIIQSFYDGPLFDKNTTVNISVFEYASPNAIETEFESKSIKLGIISSENILIDLLWEYQVLNEQNLSTFLDSVELIDLNHDGSTDIIIHYNDQDNDFNEHILSSFLLNKDGKFQEISETLVKSRYIFLENNHIKYSTPLSTFGRPYLDDDDQQKTPFFGLITMSSNIIS